MEITRTNYEEYALDYIEGTLGAQEREAFVRFLDENPEIAAQVLGLQADMPVVTPDRSIRFEGKEALKRKAPLRPLFLRVAAAAIVLLLGVGMLIRFRATSPVPTAPETTLLSEATPSVASATQPVQIEQTAPITPVTPIAQVVEAIAPLPKATSEAVQEVVPEIEALSEPAIEQPVAETIASLPVQEPAVEAGETEPELAVETLAEEIRVEEVRGKVEPITETAELLAENTEVPVQVIVVTHQWVTEQVDPSLPDSEAEGDWISEPNQMGFLNLLTRRGLRKFASDILTPLSAISPITVRENNGHRVVELASIPISRLLNRSDREARN
ncbi:MAG: hypothetical protein LBM20_00110 [Rikenellaceae bacterium]|jgi:cytoskeletal protein RodZ|nr:hypothetical protein [Rikenellaceae bacterium]